MPRRPVRRTVSAPLNDTLWHAATRPANGRRRAVAKRPCPAQTTTLSPPCPTPSSIAPITTGNNTRSRGWHSWTPADWQAALQALPPRQPRQLLACQYVRQPPAAAPCWVYQCLSGNDAHAHWQETLTLQQQADGSWQVAGYFVRPADGQQGGTSLRGTRSGVTRDAANVGHRGGN